MDLDFISLLTAAGRLKISVTTLRTWVREGRVPSYRLGQRFTRVSWAELLEALSKGASGGTQGSDDTREDSQ